MNPHNPTKKELEAFLRHEIEEIAFKKAHAMGLVLNKEQLKVTLRILSKAESDILTDADWKNLFALELTDLERNFLLELWRNGNKPINLHARGFDWRAKRELKKKVSSCPPFVIGQRRRGHLVKKVLLTVQ